LTGSLWRTDLRGQDRRVRVRPQGDDGPDVWPGLPADGALEGGERPWVSQARRPRVVRRSHPSSVLTPRRCRRLISLREEEDMTFRPAAALKPLPDARPGASYSSRRRPELSKWQQVDNTPPCTSRKTRRDRRTKIRLRYALSATDRNQPQAPRLPRNEGVRGSNPRVGFRKAPLIRGLIVRPFRSGEAGKGLLVSPVGPRLAPQNHDLGT
jgi:hypothetical protein